MKESHVLFLALSAVSLFTCILMFFFGNFLFLPRKNNSLYTKISRVEQSVALDPNEETIPFFASSILSAVLHSIALNIEWQNNPNYHCINFNLPSSTASFVYDSNIFHSAFRSDMKRNFLNKGDKLEQNPARINAYLEVPPQVESHYKHSNYPKSQSIWIVINPEWFPVSFMRNVHIGVIVARTQMEVDMLETYRRENKKDYAILYTKFTSQDIYQPEIPKRWNEIFHIGDRDHRGNTRNIILAWLENVSWPKITIRHRNEQFCDLVFDTIRADKLIDPSSTVGNNIDIECGLISNEEKKHLQNKFGVHIYPSYSESFGHNINEARSSGAMIITSDASPMNEMVNSKIGIRIGTLGDPIGIFQLPTSVVSKDAIKAGMEKFMKIPRSRRKLMGENARAKFLSDRAEYHRRMKLISNSFCQKYINLELVQSFLF